MATTNTPTVERTSADHDPYMAPAEVAYVLGITREYAGRLMRTGVIPGVVDLATGGVRATLRVRRSALHAWLDTRAL